jgi:hypothetical protein
MDREARLGGSAGEVQRQVRLPTSKAVEIALRSLRVRLARSILTLVTIVMAIAFMTTMWAGAISEVAVRRASLIQQGLADVAPPADPQRLLWLISLSLLVCMVGISNAMLMSVMERFREIGTMKCLGALDSFILKLFLLESAFLGAVGTAVGVAFGLLLNMLLLMKNFGTLGATALPWNRMPLVAAGSFVIGLCITSGAALYPAWKAARMQPIAAMRVEV